MPNGGSVSAPAYFHMAASAKVRRQHSHAMARPQYREQEGYEPFQSARHSLRHSCHQHTPSMLASFRAIDICRKLAALRIIADGHHLSRHGARDGTRTNIFPHDAASMTPFNARVPRHALAHAPRRKATISGQCRMASRQKLSITTRHACKHAAYHDQVALPPCPRHTPTRGRRRQPSPFFDTPPRRKIGIFDNRALSR